jgi:uncharacterized protein (TIGR02271 family)
MTNPQQLFEQLDGAAVRNQDGDKLGKVDAVFVDTATDQPTWLAVKSGLFGSHVSLMPIAATDFDGETITVPYTKDQLNSAPHHDPDTALTPAEEDELFRHYKMSSADSGVAGDEATGQYDGPSTDRSSTQMGAADVGRNLSGASTDDAMTRSEEQLHVGTEQVEIGRARLRKYVVTEQVTRTVPVSHEEVRLEREPISDTNRDAALAGPDISEEEHEVVLHAERPVVEKETVPVERVRLDTDTVTDDQTVSEEVRREEIDLTEGQEVHGRNN